MVLVVSFTLAYLLFVINVPKFLCNRIIGLSIIIRCKTLCPISGTFLSFVKILKLRIIAKKILRDFWKIHQDGEQQIKAWYQETSKAEWSSPNKIKIEYPSASFLADNRVVFNIKGNHYRIIIKINYDYQMIWI